MATKQSGRGEGRRFRKGTSGNPNGAPKKDLFTDSDRYTLAWVLSLQLRGRTLDSAARIQRRAEMLSWTIHEIPEDLQHLQAPGRVLVSYVAKHYPGRPITIKGGAWSIQKRIQKYQRDKKAALWLQTMAMIWTLATNSDDENLVIDLATKINEIPISVCVVIPWMRARTRLKNEELAVLEGLPS